MCPKGSERRDRQVVCQSDAERHGPEPCLDSLQAFGFVQFTVWKNLRVATPFTQLRSFLGHCCRACKPPKKEAEAKPKAEKKVKREKLKEKKSKRDESAEPARSKKRKRAAKAAA